MTTDFVPRIAAIICTHNRDEYLGAAIDSLLAQTLPPEDYEIIVIDNASTDRTPEIVQARSPQPHLTYIYEETLGLSVARNTGAQVAKAPILAYLDDDAVASPGWLAELLKGFDHNDKLAIAGGKVTLIWPEGSTIPPWLSVGLSENLGHYDLGDQPVQITNPGLTPRGLNYALRRSFLTSIGGFDLNLGRVGKNLLSNEELQMTELALNNGWQVMYLPDALAAHNVAPERMQRQWFLRRGWWQGISECYREQQAGRIGRHQINKALEYIARGVYKASIKYWNQPGDRFENWVFAYGQIGYLIAVLKVMAKSQQNADPRP